MESAERNSRSKQPGCHLQVGRGGGVGRGLGVGALLGRGMYWMVSTGGLALSRVSNRFAVRGRLVSQHQPAKVTGWVVQPLLHIGNHLR